MKKIFLLAIITLGFSIAGQTAVLISPTKNLSQLYAEIPSKELSRMSLATFESNIGRKLTREEIVEFRQEKHKAKKIAKKPLFGREGGFPWWSLALAILSIVVLIVVVI